MCLGIEIIPDVPCIVFVTVATDWNVEYRVDEVAEQLKCGMFEAGIIYDLFRIIVHVNALCHLSNSVHKQNL